MHYAIDPQLVQEWAQKLSESISSSVTSSTGADELRGLYKAAWDQGLGSVSNGVGAGRITESVKALEDLFQNTRDNVLSPLKAKLEEELSATDWRSRTVGVHCSGDPTTTVDCVDTTQFTTTFFSEGSAPGHLNHSTVTFFPGVNKASPEVQKELSITASLTPTFIDIDTKHRTGGEHSQYGPVFLQYYASQSGFMRWFPGRSSWEGEASFDARERPWYVIAATGPKKVVLVLDNSGSMGNGGRWQAAQDAAKTVLRTLTIYDWVNVVMFSDFVTLPSCFEDTLVRATPANLQELERFVDRVEPGGGTDFMSGLEAAYNMLDASTEVGCHPIILFMTDGEDHVDPTGVTQTNFMAQRDPHSEVRMFTYGLSNDAAEEAPKVMAERSGGIYTKITATSDLKTTMAKYYQYLAQHVKRDYVFSSPYLDAQTKLPMITLAHPIFDTSCTPPVFTGVVATDIILTEVMRLIYYENTDSHYIAIVSNTGQVITHPNFLSPEDERLQELTDFNYVDISTLELPMGHSSVTFSSQVEQQFGVVRDAIIESRPISNVNITMPRLKIGGDVHKAGVRGVDVQVTYNCQPVVGSTFSMCEVIEADAAQSIEWKWTNENIPQSWYHRIDVSPGTANTLAMQTNSELLTAGLRFQGVEFNAYRSMEVSTIVAAARVFQNPKGYINDVRKRYQNPFRTQQEIDQTNLLQLALNTNDGIVPSLDHRFKPSTLADVHLTQPIGNIWKSNFNQTEHSLLFYGSSTGTFHLYPGSNYAYTYDPLTRFWYNQVTHSTANTIVTTPYIDAATGETVTTAGQKIKVQCGQNCEKIQGAIAFDWAMTQLQAAVNKASNNSCFSWGTNNNEVPEDKYNCFLVDSSAFLVYHPVFWSLTHDQQLADIFMGDHSLAQPNLVELTFMLQRNNNSGLHMKEEQVIDYTDAEVITYFEFSHSPNPLVWSVNLTSPHVIAKVPDTNVYMIVSKGPAGLNGVRHDVSQPVSRSVPLCDSGYQRGFASKVANCDPVRLSQQEIDAIGSYCNLPTVNASITSSTAISDSTTNNKDTTPSSTDPTQPSAPSSGGGDRATTPTPNNNSGDDGGGGGSNVGVIIGAVIGGLLFLGLVIAGIIICRKKKGHNNKGQAALHIPPAPGINTTQPPTTSGLNSVFHPPPLDPTWTEPYHGMADEGPPAPAGSPAMDIEDNIYAHNSYNQYKYSAAPDSGSKPMAAGAGSNPQNVHVGG